MDKAEKELEAMCKLARKSKLLLKKWQFEIMVVIAVVALFIALGIGLRQTIDDYNKNHSEKEQIEQYTIEQPDIWR